MNILGNVLWLVFGGLISALGWMLIGALWCVSIIGIPVGLQCFKFAKLTLWPFGKEIDHSGLGAGSVLLNVLWIVFGGLEQATASVIMGVFCCLTIVGIPFGIQHFKFALLALMPFGARVRAVC